MTTPIKHTPSPWIRKPTASGNYFIYPDGSMTPIAGVSKISDTRSVEENNANADLIAAAPELLEALKQMIEEGFGYVDVETGIGMMPEKSETLIKAEKLIEKIEGVQP